MLDFPRWKVFGICGVLLIAVLLAIPSLVPERYTNQLPVALPRINLGLDLAGGSYILLEADTADVAAARIENMREQVAAAMRNTAPRIDISDISGRDGKLSFMVRDASQVDEARERLLPMTTGAGLTGQRDWDIQVVDGTRFELTPTPAGLKQAIDTAMADTTEVVRRRIDALGTREPTIIRQGTDRIVVQVPGLQNPQALKDLLGKTAKLEMKLVDMDADPQQVAQGNVPIGDVVLPNLEGGGVLALKRATIISGDQLTDARQAFDPQTNAPIVNFSFNGEGSRRFARITTENQGKLFAIVVDNQIISSPRINTPILGGQGYIQGSFTVESANALAIALRSGKLSVDLKVVDESTVGPDLGNDSIRAGILASGVAAAAVIVFMLVTYGRFGVYANLAVIINVFVILAAMAIFGATLTLPGIAGFVLTIGTAVDANVLINERIREERRRGRNVVQAVELGYKEASRTIFEANMTHAISGVIMLLLGSGPVKGFAVVLLIGIATSVFTAVLFTRMLVALWIRRNRPTDITI